MKYVQFVFWLSGFLRGSKALEQGLETNEISAIVKMINKIKDDSLDVAHISSTFYDDH